MRGMNLKVRARIAVGTLTAGLLLAGALPLAAQSTGSELSQTERERQFRELADRDKQFDELAVESEYLQKAANVLRKVVHLVKPAVVHIDSKHDDSGRFGKHSIEEAGSGTIIQYKDRLYVLTNRHVVKDAPAEAIAIKLADGREINPTRIWMDKPTDIAVMAVDAKNLVPARIGNTADLDIGDFVIAVGSPFGLSHSVTFGIVSAKGRRDLKLDEVDSVRYQDFLQTDAAINPGNSGGPLVNLKGEVIGMNTAIASSSGGSEGIGFTIPIDMAVFVAKQLIDRGSVTRAYLGVKLDEKFTAAEAIKVGLTHPCGARVSAITPKSSAEAAKLQANDVILEFNGIQIENDSHLIFLVSLTEVGKEVPIVVYRGGQTMKLAVRVGDRSTFEAAN